MRTQLEQVLRYVRDWNTNGKLSAVAQAVLHTVLRRFAPDELLALKEIKTVCPMAHTCPCPHHHA
jgi:U3 small nucleolar RNA-associated protein 13